MPKFDLNLSPPLMNAAGTLGFAPNPYGPVNLEHLGAFITNPVSMAPRGPAHGDRLIHFSGGFLLHTGYPNPGLKKVLRRYARQWERSPLPVIVHILAQDVDEISAMLKFLEGLDGVMGVELGLPPEINAQAMLAWIQAVMGELPVVIRLPMERIPELAPIVLESGANAISLAPPRGALSASSSNQDLKIIQGRLYGPSIFPLALAAVQVLVELELPVIAAGGIYRQEHIETMLAAGALGVQLDTVLWRGF